MAEELSLLSVHCPEMKKTGRLPPPLNTPEPLPHALTWPATWPPLFYGTTRWTRAEVAALKGRGHRQVRTRTALFAAISSVPAKSPQLFAHAPTEERRERGGGWRGVLRVEAVPPDSQSDAGPRMSLCPRSHSCRWWGFTAFFFLNQYCIWVSSKVNHWKKNSAC